MRASTGAADFASLLKGAWDGCVASTSVTDPVATAWKDLLQSKLYWALKNALVAKSDEAFQWLLAISSAGTRSEALLQALKYATRQQDAHAMRAVQQLLSSGVDDNAGVVALHSFVSYDRADGVAVLLRSGVSAGALWKGDPTIEAPGVDQLSDGPMRKTPLATAVWRGNLEIMKMLLDAGAATRDVVLSEHRNTSALEVAARGGHLAVVDALLDLDGWNAVQDKTPILAAAGRGHAAVVERLVGFLTSTAHSPAGVVDDTPDSLADLVASALMAAASSCHASVAQKLLEVPRAALLAVDILQGDLLKEAFKHHCVDVANAVLHADPSLIAKQDTEAHWPPLAWAVVGAHLPSVQLLLTAGADAGTILAAERGTANYRGWSVLELAVAEGQLGIVQLLLKYGAAVDRPRAEGVPDALATAFKSGSADMAEALLEAGSCCSRKRAKGALGVLDAGIVMCASGLRVGTHAKYELHLCFPGWPSPGVQTACASLDDLFSHCCFGSIATRACASAHACSCVRSCVHACLLRGGVLWLRGLIVC